MYMVVRSAARTVRSARSSDFSSVISLLTDDEPNPPTENMRIIPAIPPAREAAEAPVSVELASISMVASARFCGNVRDRKMMARAKKAANVSAYTHHRRFTSRR